MVHARELALDVLRAVRDTLLDPADVEEDAAVEAPAAIRGTVEEGAPGLELAHPCRRLLRVQLGHARVVEVLAATYSVGERGRTSCRARPRSRAKRPRRPPPSRCGPRPAATCTRRRRAPWPPPPPRRPAARRRPRRSPARRSRGSDGPPPLSASRPGAPAPVGGEPHSRSHPRSQDPPVDPQAHRAETHVEVGEAHPEQRLIQAHN